MNKALESGNARIWSESFIDSMTTHTLVQLFNKLMLFFFEMGRYKTCSIFAIPSCSDQKTRPSTASTATTRPQQKVGSNLEKELEQVRREKEKLKKSNPDVSATAVADNITVIDDISEKTQKLLEKLEYEQVDMEKRNTIKKFRLDASNFMERYLNPKGFNRDTNNESQNRNDRMEPSSRSENVKRPRRRKKNEGRRGTVYPRCP